MTILSFKKLFWYVGINGTYDAVSREEHDVMKMAMAQLEVSIFYAL